MRLGVWLGLLLALLALGQDVATQKEKVRSLEAEAARARALEEKAQAQIRRLNQELARLSQRVQNLLAEKARLEAAIRRLEGERQALRREIAGLKESIRETEARIAKLEDDLAALKGRLKALMRSLYRERSGRYLPLLRAQSFTDLGVRARWVGYISRQDAELVRRFQATLKALKEERERLALLLADLTAKEAALAENQRQLESERKSLEATLKSLRQEEEGKKALLRDALAERGRLQRALAELQAKVLEERRRLLALQEEERRRQEEQRRRQSAQAPPPQVVVPPPPLPAAVGRLAFPVPGGRVLVPYGQEGPFQVLQGPAPGSPVQAAADGYVAGILYLPNLGYTVMLVHTEALSTVYTNLQEPLVQEGQRVRQGQVLGYTGGGLLIPPDELEFRVAVRVGEETRFVDPAAYY
ncbi:Septal ring factor EnvC, activator of murein hydrolases AmiA and AmiB [Thermus arciformis]|uniref:Septal ring factor EnvC, activator of murein hydrolases AmiA and AmiB n=1 Tax=Thermus arciformis TaxID=482827 RepID=A0A1G7DLM9_9DEIN|nr:peptidoglycan DD-metalloendopeptidase family protein [Thermus arciformis]SDE51980.1 Septal ring factor EnvC, activator of murein hydrolases AmiA and AmiB [Thermus arciformis]